MMHGIRHIHFVGIGGAGMSGIAEVLLDLGYVISGSDLSDSATLQRLSSLGVTVHVGHAASQVGAADAVVTSSAVRADNPELLAAHAQGIAVVSRSVMLAELMRYKTGIAIAGTHGKTTTSSLVASILTEAGLDPSFVIGGRLNSAGANARLGQGDAIVVEADESDASFLNLLPLMAVVTNIDADHMQTYDHDFGQLKSAFVAFLNRMPFYGTAVLCTDDAAVREIVPRVQCRVVSYGFEQGAQLRAAAVSAVGTQMKFTLQRAAMGAPDLPIVLNLTGRHNVLNALAAIAIAQELDVSDTAVQAALASFQGVGRRFQGHGEVRAASGGEFTLIEDYGHHPVEMVATLAAARGAFPGRRLLLGFQPHRFSRTRDCFDDFVKVLGQADGVLLCEVYAAGEPPIPGADGRSLARAVHEAGGVEPLFVDDIEAMAQAIAQQARAGDVVLCMGAGSIGDVPARVLELAQCDAAPKSEGGVK